MRDTRLNFYLQHAGITRDAFAKSLSAYIGQRVDPSMISRWATGDRKPSLAWRHIIAQFTEGAIVPGDWEEK